VTDTQAGTRDRDFLALGLGSFHDALEDPGPFPAAGAAAATAAALAASLVAMTARATEGWAESPGIAAQAVKLRRRLTHLALTDAEAFAAALAELDGSSEDRGRHVRLARALDRAAELPLAIAETAADTAALAALAADRCVPRHRADAVAGAALAEGATRAAALLVETNLLSVPGDDRVARARAAVEEAVTARRLAEERA
jgi:methenyltetrahydrofolate cyclohydrolase